MLRLRRLEIDGFGPFATKQVVDFPAGPGVVVVHGENMRGKTSLLNALRFALYGKVLGRGSAERSLHTLSNRAVAATEGRYGFRVGLWFSLDGTDYELQRSWEPKQGVTPQSDLDYDPGILVRRGNEMLSTDAATSLLARALPEEVSRFFLFDGELLQEYEVLLRDGNKAGRTISKAIESILGVPMLRAAKVHLLALGEEATKRAAKAGKKHKATEHFSNSLLQAQGLKAAQQKELLRLKSQAAELEQAKVQAEAYLASEGRYRDVVTERNQKAERLEQAKAEHAEALADLQRALAHGWRTVLTGPVVVARAEAADVAQKGLSQAVIEIRKAALAIGHCTACDRPLHGDDAAHVASLTGSSGTPEVQAAFARLRDLGAFVQKDVREAVSSAHKRGRRLTIEIASLTDAIDDLEAELQSADVAKLEKSEASLGELALKLAVVRKGIEDTEEVVAGHEASIKRLTGLLKKAGDPELAAHQARAEMFSAAAEVFDAAVERYKSQKRERVQCTATDLFLNMTTEKQDYAGLQINTSYGLNIVHTDQSAEEGRSAGAEHVVALALMGSLQANAPLRGPIMMDSPFGRLDPAHTHNVVKTLPTMAEQVILLVHSGEVTSKEVRMTLKMQLLAEYKLNKISARETEIVRLTT